MLKSFFFNFNFWSTLFSKICPMLFTKCIQYFLWISCLWAKNYAYKDPQSLKFHIRNDIITNAYYSYFYMHFSMTQLFTHSVAHSTRPSFRPKTNNQPFKKFLSLVVTWVKVVKMCQILTFKVNFLCQ